MTKSVEHYLQGRELYGDDFDHRQLQEWYDDEKEGYADLGAKDAGSYAYGYHALNNFHGYRHVPDRSFPKVMGFGSAYGDELLPIISRVGGVTIVDPSEAFIREEVHGVKSRYVKPNPDGKLPLDDGEFDLIACFGVLHHIPNVSFVVGELARTLKTGGYLLLREPIVSMGDWRHPRKGLTKRERGIPLHLLRAMFARNGLEIRRQSLCVFPLTTRLFRGAKHGTFNSPIATRVDSIFSHAFAWNLNYHPRNSLERLRPTSAFFVLEKIR